MHRVLCQILPAFLVLWPISTPIHAQQPEHITLEAHAITTPFPHFWEQIFDSGRATLALRENYRKDIRSVKQAAEFHHVGFHDILDDEARVYTADEHGNPVYNFSTSAKLRDNRLTLELTPNTLLLIKVQP